jgi:hypothetical protein
MVMKDEKVIKEKMKVQGQRGDEDEMDERTN